MNNTYVPLHNHSFFSLLDGLSSPKKLAKRAKEIGSPAIALTDHGSISGMVDFQKACKKHGIKPIIGTELYICRHDPSIKNNDNNKRNHLTILAKNENGIKDLMNLITATNNPDWFYRKPRIDLENLKQFGKNGNLICLSGCLAGELTDSIFTNVNEACKLGADKNRINECRKLLKPNWKDIAFEICEKYRKVFGKENYFLELQTEGMVSQDVAVECLRELAKATNIRSVSTLDSHYSCKGDAEDQRILLYSQMHTTAEEQERLRQNNEDSMAFFYLDNFYIFDYEEMTQHFSSKEIETTLEISDMINETSFGRKPCLPKYSEKDSNELIKELCIEGAKEKLYHLTKDKKEIYWERLKKELAVIKEAKLADYFLIVYDICKFIDENKQPRGKGRGSGAGCLINYLLHITKIDPIEYDLYFERFYNAGRNTEDHISLPDIDLDISVDFREKVIEYLIKKYGQDKVSQMVTFGRLQGRAALKEVFRAQPELVKHLIKVKAIKEGKDPEEAVLSPLDLCNEITNFIPNEAEIIDEINQIREETENDEYGILTWSLDHQEQIKEYYKWYKPLFDQAIRIEGTKKSQGKHAAGVVIADIPIGDLVPMVHETVNKTRIVGLEMSNAEQMGCVKFDLLGIVALDKVRMCENLINGVKC